MGLNITTHELINSFLPICSNYLSALTNMSSMLCFRIDADRAWFHVAMHLIRNDKNEVRH